MNMKRTWKINTAETKIKAVDKFGEDPVETVEED